MKRGLTIEELPTVRWLLLLAIALVLNVGVLIAIEAAFGPIALLALAGVEAALIGAWAVRRWPR